MVLRGTAGVDGDNQPAELIAFYGYVGDVVSSFALHKDELLLSFWEDLLTKMGYERADVLSPIIPFFPCNSWMGTAAFVKRYKAFALKTSAFIEEDPDLHFRAYQTAHYPGHMSKQALSAISGGYPWYTYHAFIFERLPCFFAWITNTKVYATSFGEDMFADWALWKRWRERERERERELDAFWKKARTMLVPIQTPIPITPVGNSWALRKRREKARKTMQKAEVVGREEEVEGRSLVPITRKDPERRRHDATGWATCPTLPNVLRPRTPPSFARQFWLARDRVRWEDGKMEGKEGTRKSPTGKSNR